MLYLACFQWDRTRLVASVRRLDTRRCMTHLRGRMKQERSRFFVGFSSAYHYIRLEAEFVYLVYCP